MFRGILGDALCSKGIVMSRICFVTYEIYPTTWGGCGVLLHNAAQVLLKQGHEIIFILDVPLEFFERFKQQDRHNLPQSEQCRAYHVDSLCHDIELQRSDFLSQAQWQSWRFHIATQKVAEMEHPDIIEFFDYCGVGHYALAAKVAGIAYQHSQLTIRLHNSLELMDRYEATKPLDFERYYYHALERSALQMAETIVYPSQSYLDEAYKPWYGPWFGQQIWSKPPLVNIPKPAATQPTERTILYYGRLFAFKGVDRFIDAAVAFLIQHPTISTSFTLVGYDSGLAPDGSASYQEYLSKKIPAHLLKHFIFTGHLDRDDFEQLLPRVLFAVFPSYLEAFCYAAHELYAAGIPLIVSDIPNFKDYFKHNENALVFDGSVKDLTQQMYHLYQNQALRQQITNPFPVADDPLGTFYNGPFYRTWINHTEASLPSLLVCILVDQPNQLEATLTALRQTAINNIHVVIFAPPTGSPGETIIRFLGASYVVQDVDGNTIIPTDLHTAETLLLLRSGDIPVPTYITRCLKVLGQQSEIVFVGSWKTICDGDKKQTQTFPVDAALELAAFCGLSPYSRTIMRTSPNKLLVDLFDPQAEVLGELAYLWKLDSGYQRGLLIPEPLIDQSIETAPALNQNLLSYLIMQDTSSSRRIRLSHYLLAIWGTLGDPTSPQLGERLYTLERQLREIHHSRGWKFILRIRQFKRLSQSTHIYTLLILQKLRSKSIFKKIINNIFI